MGYKKKEDTMQEIIFEQAEIANYTPEERREYEASVKNHWDYFSTMETAVLKEKKNTACKMKADGMALELIAKYTGLTKDEIEML